MLVDGAMVDEVHVTATDPTATDGGNLAFVDRSSIRVDTTTSPTATDEVVWRTFDSVWAERTIRLSS